MNAIVDIFVPDHSLGLRVQAEVIREYLKKYAVRILVYPFQACSSGINENTTNLRFEPSGDTAIFVERLFDHAVLSKYKKRVLLPHSEWLTDQDLQRAIATIDIVWHLTRHSEKLLIPRLPNKQHYYLGFTSLARTNQVKSYESFSHTPGKQVTRHTQEIINIWLRKPSLPKLRVQFYSGISLPRWLNIHNIDLYMGFLSDEEYRKVSENHGIHLCTSQMEGFGHYINESRQSAALIISLDAPPMNELINKECGLLVPAYGPVPNNNGERFFAKEHDIEAAIDKALSLSMNNRKELGENAKKRFEKDREDFILRLRDAI